MPGERRHSGFAWAGCLIVAVLGAVVYINTLDGEFVWDDVSSVLLHEHVQDTSKLGQLFRENQHAFSSPGGDRPEGRFYRPLVSLSFMIDFALAYDAETQAPTAERPYPDVKPFIFHVTNIVWHVLAGVLLFLLLLSLRTPQSVALGVATLFVVHPLHTEAVAYISGRADMMSAAFMFAGLLATAIRGTLVRNVVAALLCGLCFLAGLFSKESAAIFPLLLLIVIWLRLQQDRDVQRPLRDHLPRLAPLAGAIAGGLVYFVVRSGADLPPAQGTVAAGLLTRLVEVGQSLALYVRLLFWPTNLHMERDSLAHVPGVVAVLGYAFLAAVIVGAVWALRKNAPAIAAGLLWFVVTWLPISGIFPLNAPMAEHWMYVPMAGFWWSLGLVLFALNRATAWRQAVAVVAAALVLFFGVRTIERNEDWQSNTRLYRATLAQNPNTMRVHYNLAVTYENLTGNTAGARRHFAQAAKLGAAGASPDTMLSIAETLFSMGHYQEAYLWFARLIGTTGPGLAPYKPSAAAGIGRCYLALGYFQPASRAFQQASQFDPGYTSRVRAWEAGAPL